MSIFAVASNVLISFQATRNIGKYVSQKKHLLEPLFQHRNNNRILTWMTVMEPAEESRRLFEIPTKSVGGAD